MADQKPVIIDDDNNPALDVETRLELADLDHQLLESERKLLESKKRKIMLAHEHKLSRNKGPHRPAKPGVAETERSKETVVSTQDRADGRDGNKRIKVERGLMEARTPPQKDIVDLTKSASPADDIRVRDRVARPQRRRSKFYKGARLRPDVDYRESETESLDLNDDSDSDSEAEDSAPPNTPYNYRRINPAFPTICRMPDGSLAELHCSGCHSNAMFRDGEVRFLEVGRSLQTHYVACHRELTANKEGRRLTCGELMEMSVYKILSAAKAAAVRGDTQEDYHVEVALTPGAQMRYDQSRGQRPKKKSGGKANQALASAAPGGYAQEEDDDDEEQDPGPPTPPESIATRTSMADGDDDGRAPAAKPKQQFARKSAPGGGALAYAWPWRGGR
ncbi:uncharacterized protein MYCGRDRAFT_93485 [Zymoseptoria tritici IPO323]|uniref:Uncharacterized protein n=1 Tax=Zymoseptoria tritici (strain CBS 115943 / IPO323) TaxID=336722 RepID=F9XC66_ZYMTI|nr:uncharacterized protein MYCGRDRAFT_93485 [Zymoseptoria tritici IPO323]EGP87449.1 hypothetical protein MYCGRDRAFT_93485 [Zymoseptoria tritici IPO323]